MVLDSTMSDKSHLAMSDGKPGGAMAEGRTPKKDKGRSKGQEGRVTLRIRHAMIKELQEMADSEELSLSAYIRQLLKHEIISKKT